ncbi:hypothetical protein CDAR_265991 [Caerostris darwini]|uniref:Uncharacterized protein n=1 Tax=Caerostris darwini TaxID=1538125 RepID=A0AAV4QSS3_9ARAC|nr:hypothetical protein CDAR_265991 [Caerostris darwini]
MSLGGSKKKSILMKQIFIFYRHRYYRNSETTCHRQVHQGSLFSIVHQFSERTKLSVIYSFLSIGSVTFFNKLPRSKSEEETSHPAPHEGHPSVCEG